MNIRTTRGITAAGLACATLITVCAVAFLRSGMFAELLAGSMSHAEDEVRFPAPEPVLELRSGDVPVASNGWPQLFGPTHDSISPERDVETNWPEAGPPVIWRQPVGVGYSSPVVWDKRLIVLHRVDDEEIVQCFNSESGSTDWDFRYPTAYKCRFEHSSGPYSTPVIDGELVYALGAEGKLHCLTLNEGRLIWSRSLNEEFRVPEGIYAVGYSPLLEDDRLILNVGGSGDQSGIVALDKSSGKTLWTATNHPASYATPRAATIHGHRFVFVLTAFGLVALDPATGSVQWTIEFHAAQPDAVSAASPLVYGDIVLVSAYQAGSLCFRILPDGKYEELWRNRRNLVSQFNPMTCADGHVYGWHLLDKSFRCMELTTGKLKWTYKASVCRGTHLVVGDRMILLGEYGELACVDVNPEEVVERAMTGSSLMTSPCFSSPALYKGRLFLRNERELLCLDLRKRPSTAD